MKASRLGLIPVAIGITAAGLFAAWTALVALIAFPNQLWSVGEWKTLAILGVALGAIGSSLLAAYQLLRTAQSLPRPSSSLPPDIIKGSAEPSALNRHLEP